MCQIWFADDAASTASFDALREWLAKLVKLGPSYGYFVNPKKTWLIVKDETKLEEVKAHFHGTGINVTSDAKKHLGAWLGDKSSVIDHLKTKIDEWINTIVFISEVAKSQPHATYSAFTNGIISQWLYTMRTSPDVSSLLQPLEDGIRTKFLPSHLGRVLGDLE